MRRDQEGPRAQKERTVLQEFKERLVPKVQSAQKGQKEIQDQPAFLENGANPVFRALRVNQELTAQRAVTALQVHLVLLAQLANQAKQDYQEIQ